MNFNSPEYLIFLPLVVLLHAALLGKGAAKNRARHTLLLVASYAFYMSWDWRYAGLIAFSTVVDYGLGRALGVEGRAQRVRNLLLVVSLSLNLGLLAVFKYFNFFMDTTQDGLALLGLDVSLPHHQLLLPVGISFYTFQTLSYTIDVWRRQLPVERDFVKFALFVSFFPQLVAGPIVRASEFLPQLQTTPELERARVRGGLFRIFRGLFKKVVLADLLANLGVDAVFANPGAYSSLDLTLALYGYAYQIYNDFSGYSDIAIGSAALLGYHIPENFNRPYLARNVREFWTRWHISLSSWLRDYLYIPLGGNRDTRKGRTTRNLMITMLLGGLWHGAALNFVLWGAYHGVLLAFSRQKDRHAANAGRPLTIWLERTTCFHLVLGGWLLFRVTGWDDLVAFFAGWARFDLNLGLDPLFLVVLVAAATVHLYPRKWVDGFGERFARLPAPVQGAAYAGLVLALCGATLKSPSFIYFQF